MSDRPKEYLLILGGSSDQLYLQRIAREMGIGVCCVDANDGAPGLSSADHSAPINFSNHEAVIAWVRGLVDSGINVAGVSSMGSDHPEAIGAIADAFGWSAPTPKARTLARDKYEMMCAWRDAGVPIPRFDVVTSADDITSLASRWGCDAIVVKPTIGAGSRGVSILVEPKKAAIIDAFNRASREAGHVLVEEFVPGLQLSTEAVYSFGHDYSFAIGDRNYSDQRDWLPQPMENGGYVPTALHPKQAAEVERVATLAARALDIHTGPAKGDMVWSPGVGPVMIEMGARLSGGDFASGTYPTATGADYVRTAIEIALGHLPATEPVPTKGTVAANRYLFSPPGVLEAARGFDEVSRMPGVVKLELWYRQGEMMPPIDQHGRRRGVFIVEGASRAEVDDLIAMVYGRLELAVGDYGWLKCHPNTRRQWIQ